MKLIESKAEYIPQASGLEGIYKQIEKAARTCYKSEAKCDGTFEGAKAFVDRMIASNHTAMLEAGTVYLFFSISGYDKKSLLHINDYEQNPYSKVLYVGVDDEPDENGNYLDIIGNPACGNMQYVISTNLRVLQENNWLDDLKYICDPTKFHEKRYTFRLTTSIGVTRELNRHRVNSIAEMSTRYCNFSKDKFGNEVIFCLPVWIDRNREPNTDEEMEWLESIKRAEYYYLHLLEKGWQPQQAREVLPLCTASEIVHTAFSSDFRHFFDLRLFGKTGAPHPNMLHLAKLMQAEAEKAGIWEDIMKQPSKFKD